LCVAGRGSLDEASAAMLAQLLQKHGIGARVVPSAAVSLPNLFALDATGVQMAYLCYLEPGSFSNPHNLVRRLRRKLPKATIVDGFWTLKADEADSRNALTKTGADLVATFLQQAVAQATAAAREAADSHLGAELRSSSLEPVSAASGGDRVRCVNRMVGLVVAPATPPRKSRQSTSAILEAASSCC
jgi:hypothetical protein